ncbi:5-formyltetrahydrofolate cyclo-ligase [Streptomyces sp. NA04227]|uniref:5-formyltetrahydrofolate cyclo-ligase n=1 Tax=Streptomyces sp. NA04227 TaxID=2742136 RepID=UPI00159116F2|nr:5-formyltetrahydrofolate cyclo-ligase [Streptomyces sp. NA04227]QKW07144.1 5-formyltetrahydrofolate cyclo-ligase [Streptomyces sp. NA04227]
MNETQRQADSGKRTLRREFLSVRNRLTEDDVREKAVLLAERALELPVLAGASTVAAYVSMSTEPGTGPLIEALDARGVRVLLPVLLADNDLSWGAYQGPDSLVEVHHRGKMALHEPSGPPLGTDAVLDADAVLLPGVAVDRAGVRLGRGGGSYDRVLARLARAGKDPALVVLLYDAEVVARLPHEPHDRPVHAAVTPSKVHRFGV